MRIARSNKRVDVVQYRKRPVVIDSVVYSGTNAADIAEFMNVDEIESTAFHITIPTLEGDHHAIPGDYIIKGVNGEFYPCKPDIFHKTYERVDNGSEQSGV
jgi:hypothetical protein